MAEKTFTLEIDGYVTLDIEEIWPAGYEAPESPTAAEVVKQIQDYCGSLPRAIVDWNLPCTLSVDGEEALRYG